jgi:putative DNA primase/helicase
MSADAGNPPLAIAPDPVAMAAFLDVLFAGLAGHVVFRMITEKGTPAGKPWTERAEVGSRLPQVAARCAARAMSNGRGFYVVPATVLTPGRAREGDISQTAVVVVDIDSGDVATLRGHLLAHLGPPTLEVASGGKTEDGQNKLHLYWRLARAATGPDLKRVHALRAEIADKIGSDPSVAKITQPIRVAGSIHGKHGILSPVTLLGREDISHDIDVLSERVAAMPALMQGRMMKIDVGHTRALMDQTVREGGQDGVTRHDALTSVTGHWLRKVRLGKITADEAWAAVRKWNAEHIIPPWTEQHLRREFDSIGALDRRRHPSVSAGDASSQGASVEAPTLSEDHLAQAFVAVHGAHWRHVMIWGRWFFWTGTHWQIDETGWVRELVRQVCRSVISSADKEKAPRSIASAKTIAAVERIASSDPRISLRVSDLDRWPMLLNTPDGIVDLETGELRAHDPALLLTQLTNAAPGSDCPTWLRFLKDVTDGDAEMIAYLARVCGYCLSGVTTEQAFFFLHGQGANGKSVFLETLSAVLGSYAATAPFETFAASTSERHPTDIAGLRGARLVTVSETEAGRDWAEARIKAITGGDTIRTRLMHKDFFEFKPTFKLMFAGNHRPRLNVVSEAMRRRLQLIPFTVTIPPERRDKRLLERLLVESDGILGWMLAGCLEWQRMGLAPPDRTTEASAEYFEDEDTLGQWIAECCITAPDASGTAAALYADWSAFCLRAGTQPGSQRWFGDALRSRGFTKTRSRVARGWQGIALRRVPPEPGSQ